MAYASICRTRSRQAKPREGGSKTPKPSVGTRWVHSHPAKAGHQPEASLASSSAMAARSVGSGYRSRVIEPRNDRNCWSLRRPSSGGSTTCPVWPGTWVRPGSKSRAKVCVGSLGTWETPWYPVEKMPDGATGGKCPGSYPWHRKGMRERNQRCTAGTVRRGKRSLARGATGSLSVFIVT